MLFFQKPKAAPKPKAAAKKATAPKKPAATKQTKLNGVKRANDLASSDVDDSSVLSHKAKKPKKASKKAADDDDDYDDNAEAGGLIAAPKARAKKSAEETYQKLTLNQHILKRPDTYIGSVVPTEAEMWVYEDETKEMAKRKITYVPGLYKIFDEILVNAADNKQADDGDNKMTYIKVTVDREAGEISVENNGKGIPVVMHATEGIYIPHMIFGHLLTGSNYDDNEKKTVGGRNGYGAKLCNVFSTEFSVEVQDSENGKRYKQVWTDNMTNAGKPKITSNKTSNFVKITFKPDWTKFNMPSGIDNDFIALLSRRVYDLAGTIRGVRVYLNNNHIKLAFKSYCEMYTKSIGQQRTAEEGAAATATVWIDENKYHEGWEVGFAVSDGNFNQVSFVNSIATTVGGTHVNYITDQITEHLLGVLGKKRKGHSLKQSHIRNHLFVFINCLIDNPAFTSQTKEQMTTKVSQFGRKCVLSDGFMKKIANSDALKNIMDFAERKADKMMSKSDGSKRSRISNAKLVDANLAGSRRGYECTLILTEGDSAKGLAVSGRAILDPDRIGVFPLRGKMLNVRDASIDQITKNQEIQNIKQFLGLKHKQVYNDTKGLRYGHLMIMADQDHDGSHIKGLLINFLQVQFPSLLKIPDFFREFITPVVKVWQGSNPKKPQRLKSFFNLPQYEEWKEAHSAEMSRWHTKYFKGLGTSSNADAQVYFSNLDEHLKEFDVMQQSEEELFELAFSKKKADARKEWLGNFVPGTFLDHTTKSITYSDFVNKELILFSMADNIRSIPSMLDGLKPGQRKVLYACFKRNLVKDQKVIELAGYVSEQTAYHHGEASLQQTIIGLAQDYVGSNNINCLEPSGNFGSRLAGGSDAASPRYIHTRLSPFARKIFSALDEPNLKHQYDDGKMIEPETYAPVLPMVLVNGADGIGTGWSTSIPNYNPIEIVENLKKRMGRLPGYEDDISFRPMQPWFRGWKGEVEPADVDRFKLNGMIDLDTESKEVTITELPIRVWTDDFKARLEEIISGVKGASFIKDYKEFNDHKTVHFVIQLDDKHVKIADEDTLREKFKLNKQIATSNLVAFDTQGRIRKYESVQAIMEEFYQYRLDMYTKRKNHWLGVYHKDYRKLRNQARFIQEIIDGIIVVGRKAKKVLIANLRERHFEAFPKVVKAKAEKDEEDEEDEDSTADDHDYDYLLSMPIWSLTQERLDKLHDQVKKKKAEHDALQLLSEKDLWCTDLDEFIAEWENQLQLDAEIQTDIRRRGRRVSKKIGAGRGRKAGGDDDYMPKAPKAKKAAPKASKLSEMEEKRAVKKEEDNFSDDDFAALGRKKSAPLEAVEANVARTKRTAAAKPKAWTFSDEDSAGSDDDAPVVRGIENVPEKKPAKKAALPSAPKPAPISAKMFIIESDEEMDDVKPPAAQLSPVLPDRTLNRPETLFDEVSPLLAEKVRKVSKPTATAKPKPKPKAAPAKASAAANLSPAALAYTAKRNAMKTGDDEDSFSRDASPSPAARRPKRAVSKTIVFDEDSEEEPEEEEEEDDPFEMDDSD